MEPRWKLSDIILIFDDQCVTQKLLVQFSIQHTCVLRGDHYHLMNKV